MKVKPKADSPANLLGWMTGIVEVGKRELFQRHLSKPNFPRTPRISLSPLSCRYALLYFLVER
jgi:hypothetical protein